MASSLLRLSRAPVPALALLVVTAACHSSPSSSEGPATCTIAVPTPPDWRLVADGTSFRDGLGRVVFLRGVDAGGRSKFAPYVPFDYPDGGYATSLAAYMDHAARWGIDVLRVPFTWAALEPTQGADDSDWLSRYDQLLDAAWARGIWTVVDFHQDVYSEVFCGDGFPGWTVPDAGPYMHDCPGWQLEYYNNAGVASAFDTFWDGGAGVQSAYVSAWDVMVARYQNRPGVLGFEPINEPGWGTADENTFSATTLTEFYSRMVAHMRAEAPSSLIFIDPPGVDGATVSTQLGEPANDGGVVFAPHYYPISGDGMLPQAGLAPWVAVGATWNVPVFLGEFGASHTDATNTAYMQSVFDALDALSLSGSEWEYSVGSEEWNSETDSIVDADGGEYPIAQAVQRPYARAVAGSDIVQAYDPVAGAFTLSFKPSSGVTEVALPPQAFSGYPGAYDTVVTGACIDATSAPGRILVQPTAGATSVSFKITAKVPPDSGS
jgi:endoglycosylceramidase